MAYSRHTIFRTEKEEITMANNPTLLTRPLAEDAQKNTIPDTTGSTTGLFSQQYGWQSINALPLQAGGKAVKREDFNGVFNLLGGVAFMAQKGFTFNWDSTQDYYVGCVVIDATDGLRYECIADVTANSTAPSADTTHWQIFKAGTDIDYWFRQKSTVYTAGDLRCTESLPYGWYLECTVAGTTDSGDITLPSPVVENAIVVDGTVTWTIRKMASTADIPAPVDISGKADITGANMAYHKDVITTSGTYTAPMTGLYKITVKGGGGGGAGGRVAGSTYYYGGAGGGEGGTTIAYAHMSVGDTANVVIGAGGTGGGPSNNGTAGGDSTVLIGSQSITAGGGGGGRGLPTDAYFMCGGDGGSGDTFMGAPGASANSAYNGSREGASGGGAGGGTSTITSSGSAKDGVNGGGGAGGYAVSVLGTSAGTNGGDGYVWFEYTSSV
jgi:hypothetical protein